MKLTPVYINRLNKEIQETERKIAIQKQNLNETIEASQIDIRQNIEAGLEAIPFIGTTRRINEIQDRITELENHIVYLQNILIKGEL
jgi:hypothetical protein